MDSTDSSIDLAEQLAACVRTLAEAGYCPATGGNFSIRVDADSLWMTASGVDKRRLTTSDLIRMGVDGQARGYGKPSAETALHLWLYQHRPDTGCVLHVHSRANTVVSRFAGRGVRFQGYEMQKAVRGQPDHESPLTLPIVENSQEMAVICRELESISANKLPFGFLVRGHGLYAWGQDLAEARRHLEGWEFLLECQLAELSLAGNGSVKDL